MTENYLYAINTKEGNMNMLIIKHLKKEFKYQLFQSMNSTLLPSLNKYPSSLNKAGDEL